MTQDDNKLQSAAQVLHCILQAAEHLRSKAVTRYTDDKQIVWSLVENKLDWYTGVGTAEHDGKWSLFGMPVLPDTRPKSRGSTGMICCITPLSSFK